jgi:phosphatidate cytidylyltransferase
MLRWRLLSASILIAIAVGAAYLDYRGMFGAPPGLWMLPLFIAAVFLGTKEMLDMFAAGGYRPTRWPVYVGTMVVALSGCSKLSIYILEFFGLSRTFDLLLNNDRLFVGSEVMAISFACCIPAIFFLEMRKFDQSRTHFPNIATSLFTIAYVGVLMAYVALLRYVNDSIEPLLSTIIIVKASDAGAYFCGRLVGRIKFAPLLSPKKTWEGTSGGIITAGFVSVVYFSKTIYPLHNNIYPMEQPGVYVAYGCLLGIVGIVGDLSISLIKREMEMKDSGQILPGLGGVLDVLDSLMPSAVVAYLFWMCGFFELR